MRAVLQVCRAHLERGEGYLRFTVRQLTTSIELALGDPRFVGRL
jgi:hypothetical protein